MTTLQGGSGSVTDEARTSEGKSPLPVTVYTPDSQLRQPRQLLQAMWHDLRASRELAWRLFVRDISAQYRQSLLGYVWAFMPPLFTTAIWVFLNGQKILNVGETAIPYPAYVLAGTLLWQGFVDAVNAPLRVVSGSRSLLAKINFPREALLLSGLGQVLFNFGIRLVLLVPVFLWLDMALPVTILLAPLGILALIAFGLSVGVILTPLGLLYGDVGRGLTLATQLWFYLTPVVYAVPDRWPASLVASVNPVSPLLITTRAWMTTGDTPQPLAFILITSATLLLLSLGWLLYRLAMPHLIERMQA